MKAITALSLLLCSTALLHASAPGETNLLEEQEKKAARVFQQVFKSRKVRMTQYRDLYLKGLQYRDGKVESFEKDSFFANAYAGVHFLPLARQGDVKAQHNFAMIRYKMGDHKSAYRWFKRASDQGFEPSLRNLHKLICEVGQKSLLSTSPTHLYALHDEALIHVGSYLFGKDLDNWKRVSKRAYSIGTSPFLVLSKETNDLKEQIVTTSTPAALYYKALRTKKGMKYLTLGFQNLLDDEDRLQQLGLTHFGAEKILFFKMIIERHDIFSPLEKVYTFKELSTDLINSILSSETFDHLMNKAAVLQSFSGRTFDDLINKALNLWSSEAKRRNPIAQFNCGMLHLAQKNVNEASRLFRRADRNGMRFAKQGLRISQLLKENRFEDIRLKKSPVTGVNRCGNREEFLFFARYPSIQFMYLRLAERTAEEASLVLAMTRDYKKFAELLLLRATRQESLRPLAGGLLADLYGAKGDTQQRLRWLRLSAEGRVSYSQTDLGLELVKAALSEWEYDEASLTEGEQWLKQGAVRNDPYAVRYIFDTGVNLYQKSKFVEAKRWFNLAADFGVKEASYYLDRIRNLEEARIQDMKKAEEEHKNAIQIQDCLIQ